MKCTQCGHSVNPGKFCIHCGKLADVPKAADSGIVNPSDAIENASLPKPPAKPVISASAEAPKAAAEKPAAAISAKAPEAAARIPGAKTSPRVFIIPAIVFVLAFTITLVLLRF